MGMSGDFETAIEHLPNLGALQTSYFALYEIFANVARWFMLTLADRPSNAQRAGASLPSTAQAQQ